MGYYIHTVIVFVIGNTIQKAVVTVMIGNYILWIASSTPLPWVIQWLTSKSA